MAVALTAGGWIAGLTAYTADAGADRLLVFAEGWENTITSAPSAVTYGGIAMTLIVSIANPSNTNGGSLWLMLDTDIPAGGNNFIVTRPNAPAQELVAAATYTGALQSAPVGDSQSIATDSSVNTLTVTLTIITDSMSIGNYSHGRTGTMTWANSYIEELTQSNPSMSRGTGDKAETTTGTSVVTPTHAISPKSCALVAASINPSGPPPPSTTTIFRPCCAQLME